MIYKTQHNKTEHRDMPREKRSPQAHREAVTSVGRADVGLVLGELVILQELRAGHRGTGLTRTVTVTVTHPHTADSWPGL